MLYLILERESEVVYHLTYNTELRKYLNSHSIKFEEILLHYYDGLFLNSDYAYSVIKKSYPVAAEETTVTGFPFDVSFAERFKHIEKNEKVIAFNQRFDMDKQHMLEVYI